MQLVIMAPLVLLGAPILLIFIVLVYLFDALKSIAVKHRRRLQKVDDIDQALMLAAKAVHDETGCGVDAATVELGTIVGTTIEPIGEVVRNRLNGCKPSRLADIQRDAAKMAAAHLKGPSSKRKEVRQYFRLAAENSCRF
jgi:hypothetical protein